MLLWLTLRRSRPIAHKVFGLEPAAPPRRLPAPEAFVASERSLLRPLPGLDLPPCLPDNLSRSPTRVTTLPNGLRVATEDIPVMHSTTAAVPRSKNASPLFLLSILNLCGARRRQGPSACIGFFVNSGSVYESGETTGVSYLLERMGFKDTKHRSHLSIVSELELAGASVSVSASREQMVYSYDTLKGYMPEALEILIDCMRNPLFLQEEVQRQVTRDGLDSIISGSGCSLSWCSSLVFGHSSLSRCFVSWSLLEKDSRSCRGALKDFSMNSLTLLDFRVLLRIH
jgi:mitochondrial-processing peptidase subunit alpha